VDNAQTYSKFPVNLDFIINHVRKKFGSEIAKSLGDWTEYVFDTPQMLLSTNMDPDLKVKEDRQSEIIFPSMTDTKVRKIDEHKTRV